MTDRYTNLPGSGAEDPLGHTSARDPSDRLESWKEIAVYLKRDLRTVQRWEKREGLPIHRHQHDERASVFAYKSEIDAWWHSGHSRLDAEDEEEGKQPPETAVAASNHSNGQPPVASKEPQEQPQPRVNRRRWPLWLGGSATAAVALVAGAVYLLRPRPSPVLHFQSRDMVLITNFENRTGDPLFDGTIEAALARELTNSQFVTVAPRVRVNDTLALMRKPANTLIDAAIGREICLRDGGIRVLVAGRIEKFGSTYLLSASLLDPSSGTAIASFEEQANGQDAVLPAVHRLSDRLRQSLGEDLSQIRQSDLALQKVTTRSLKALQLYSQADGLAHAENYATAAELLRQAVILDPKFASADVLLAWVLANRGHPRIEYMVYADRAYQLSASLRPAERYFVEGMYWVLAGQKEKAIPVFRALLRIDPGNSWGTEVLSFLYSVTDRRKRASELTVRLAQLRPNSLPANIEAAFTLSISEDDLQAAQPYWRQARTLIGEEGDQADAAPLIPLVQLFPAYESWMNDDIARARRQVLAVDHDTRLRESSYTPLTLGYFYLTLGQAQTAQDRFWQLPTTAQQLNALAETAWLRSDRATLRHLLLRRGVKGWPNLQAVWLMSDQGYLTQADAAFRELRFNSSVPSRLPPLGKILFGQLDLARWKRQEGIAFVREGLQRNNAHPIAFLSSLALARSYEQGGDATDAVRILEAVAANRPRVYVAMMENGPLWMKDEMALAQLYRRMGRVQDAEKIESELRKLLAFADPDFPMLVELNKLKSTPLKNQKPN